ncbi:MAG: hypothetical protein EOO73_16065 [Myxococcales bacterium]|nr:MAG: hypothetical protein EOO73_16065 [Myxococcales bacterium]
MKPFRFLPAAFAAPTVLLLSSFAHALAAPEPSAGCGDGPGCGFGFECSVVATSGCAPTPACAEGASCPEPEPCIETSSYGCTPAHCQVDTDCASDMVCHERTEGCAVTDCACAPGEKCDCGDPAPCETKTISTCTPRYLLPCEAAADCGAGFNCEETQSCGCSGSGGSEVPPSSGSGAAPLPPSEGGAPADAAPLPPDCSCEPTGVKQCIPQEIGCENEAGCPAGWTCEAGDVASAPACAGDGCAALPAPMPSTSTCRPPYYGGGVGEDDSGPTTPVRGDDGKGTPNDGSPTSGAPEASSGSGEGNESSACQFGPASTSRGAVSLLAVLGALFGVARRRRVK